MTWTSAGKYSMENNCDRKDLLQQMTWIRSEPDYFQSRSG